MNRNVMRIRIVFCIICTVHKDFVIVSHLRCEHHRAIKLRLGKKVFKALLFPADTILSFLDFLDEDYFQFFFLVICIGSYSRCMKGRSEACCPGSSLHVPGPFQMQVFDSQLFYYVLVFPLLSRGKS